jgi:fibronectin-binding autotransporter adhesin
MKKSNLIIGIMILAFVFASSAFAGNVLVDQQPWGAPGDNSNFTAVFGAGNFTEYNDYSSATPSAIFNASNSFVMLEGGAASDALLASYLNLNQTIIMNWVNAGGSLLLQSAGWGNVPSITFGPGTINDDFVDFSTTGTLTAAGIAAFTFTPIAPTQTGTFLAHEDVAGNGLTVYMLGDQSTPIIAGAGVGNGFIMYSTLTDSYFHTFGNGLVNDEIAFTASQAGRPAPVPEPASILLLGTGFGLIGLVSYRRKR